MFCNWQDDRHGTSSAAHRARSPNHPSDRRAHGARRCEPRAVLGARADPDCAVRHVAAALVHPGCRSVRRTAAVAASPAVGDRDVLRCGVRASASRRPDSRDRGPLAVVGARAADLRAPGRCRDLRARGQSGRLPPGHRSSTLPHRAAAAPRSRRHSRDGRQRHRRPHRHDLPGRGDVPGGGPRRRTGPGVCRAHTRARALRTRGITTSSRRGAHPHRSRTARRDRAQHVRDPGAGVDRTLPAARDRRCRVRGVRQHRGHSADLADRDATDARSAAHRRPDSRARTATGHRRHPRSRRHHPSSGCDRGPGDHRISDGCAAGRADRGLPHRSGGVEQRGATRIGRRRHRARAGRRRCCRNPRPQRPRLGLPAAPGGGYGLRGMRERVELLGGTFTAGTTTDDGWEVVASLPLRDAPPRDNTPEQPEETP